MMITENVSEIMQEKYKEGCMFLLEKYLDALPRDWHDCITFIFTNGIDQRKDQHLVVMDDEETERFMKLYNMKQAPIFVISDKEVNGKKYIWNIALSQMLNEDGTKKEDPESIFIGGEEFRKYCDERNIHYRSFIVGEGLLISSSNLQYEKKEGEDCRIPQNANS